MNVNGIGAPYGAVRPLQTEQRTRTEADRPQQAQAPAATPALREAAPAAQPTQALPVEPPAGTDPELWAVLSHDERAFFAKVGAMGPLTYGRMLQTPAAELPVARGGRLDVKA